jgi:integrase
VLLLKEHKLRSRHTAPEDYVFCTSRGTPLSQRNLLRELDRAQRHAVDEHGQPIFPGAAYVDAHGKLVLRRREGGGLVKRGRQGSLTFTRWGHTLATNLVDAGVAVEDVSKILRHKDSTTTARIYVHEIRSADALRRRADLLEKWQVECKEQTPTQPHRLPPTSATTWLP